jgi:hypothetical protein
MQRDRCKLSWYHPKEGINLFPCRRTLSRRTCFNLVCPIHAYSHCIQPPACLTALPTTPTDVRNRPGTDRWFIEVVRKEAGEPGKIKHECRNISCISRGQNVPWHEARSFVGDGGLIYRIRYRAYSLPKKEFQGMNLALRSTLQRE